MAQWQGPERDTSNDEAELWRLVREVYGPKASIRVPRHTRFRDGRLARWFPVRIMSLRGPK